ncbi:hypothetical protein JOF50_001795 [Corynebacterium mucifaciens]|uniref:AAA+ ATPase domain-containing protein n=1 Tax=Corynebacterium mucifaciens TaxID=57171 RepID=A0ABV2NZI6_9CORY
MIGRFIKMYKGGVQPSPYTPGRVTTEVFGRDAVLTDIKRDLAFMMVEPQLSGQLEVFVGPRGVGKTSLLRAAQAEADRQGFATLWVTAGDGPLLQSLVEALEHLSHSWHDDIADTLRKVIASVRIDIGGLTVEAVGSGRAPRRSTPANHLQQLLSAAGRAAMARERGLIVFVDEIQSADPDGIRAYAYAWQHMQSEQQDLAMATYAAGLSHSQDVITDAVSFAERFRYQPLYNLTPEQSATALTSLAEARGVRWDDSALDEALDIARGYPFFIQSIGDEVWKAAGYPGAGVLLEQRQVDEAKDGFDAMRSAFFRARWQKATPVEALLLQAMAQVGDGPVKRADIAAAMGRGSNELSMARRSLMDKGLIDAPQHGYLEFTAPGFADFVRDET